jgi:eukaryotic-like serine/threonine-protein kinase
MSRSSRNRTKEGKRSKIFAGRYAYKKPLGRGAGGSVYLAEDLHEGHREVALKVLSAEACETVQGKMLRREFEILSKLDHPNLVRVYDYGKLPDGGVFLAEEYIDGFSLQDARALLDPVALIDPTCQILQGLAYLHAMGMIHRDIKPANVMLLWLDDASARPMVKLVDFGLSSMDPKRDTLRGGTRSYMAPEIIRGNKGETRSDLYSLGVTLYYALCGVLPFGPRSKDDPPPTEEDFRPPEPHRLNDEVPLELSRFTMALLRQLPDVDYADAGEALQALASDAGALEDRSVGQMANSLDVAAAPVIRGYFERGILSRRIEEDDLLLEWLSMDEANGGQMYVVRGDEGSGKSRLLHDVQASAKLSGHLVLSVDCKSDQGPYELLTTMLERLIELARSLEVVSVERHLPAIWVRRRLTELGVVTPGENVRPFVEQSWMREAIQGALSMLAPHSVVYFIDDIDRADEESLEVLYEWFRPPRSGDRPSLVVTSSTGRFYSRFSRQKGVQVLPIDGVGRGDVKIFFRDQLGIDGLSDEWLASVSMASEGRPAYIEELCRFLIDGGMLSRKSASLWEARVSDIEASGVPGTLRESLRRRVTSVGAAGREALELLALVERPLAWEGARRLLRRGGASREEAERTLQTVEWRHLVTTELRAGGRYVRVIHEELADAVADMISPEWRRALHRRIGEHMARDWTRGRGTALEAATHLERGGRLEEAAPYFEIAGDLERSKGNLDAASEYFDSALKGAADGRAHLWLHLKLAAVALGRCQPRECRDHIDSAASLAKELKSPWLTCQVYLAGGFGELQLGNIGAARKWLNKICEESPQYSKATGVALLEIELLVAGGDLEDALEHLEAARKALPQFALPELRARLACQRAELLGLVGDEVKATKAFLESRKLAEKIDDASVEGMIWLAYGTYLRRQSSAIDAREALLNALELLADAEEVSLFVEALFQYAWTLTALGSGEEARKRANEAYCFARLIGHRAYEQKIAVMLGSLGLNGRSTETANSRVGQIVKVIEHFDRGDDFAIDRAEILMALGDLMITLQQKEVGPKMLQRGRQLAFKCGAKGLLPPMEG